MEQTGPRTRESCPLSGDGKILARRPEIDAVNRFYFVAFDVSHVVMLRNVRPVLAKNSLTLFVPLHLPTTAPAGGFESEIEATDAGEKTAEG